MSVFIPMFFLMAFSIFNLVGIKKNLVVNELAFIAVGFLLFVIVRKMRRHFFRINAPLFYWSLVALLIITFIIGIEVKGSRRWIDFHIFNVQGSEILKVFFILFFADFFSKRDKAVEEIGPFFTSVLFFIIPTFIILKQPDLGNALVFFFIYVVMLYFSTFSKKMFAYFLAFVFGLAPLAWMFLKSYQKERIISFLNPNLYQSSTSYNMIQAMITVGSGQFLGKGLGYGTQSNLLFLPENHTDFAFSSLVEQFGFFGGAVLIVLYGFVILYLVKKTLYFYHQSDVDSRANFLYCIGFLAFFAFQITVNIGMNLGLFPVAGIALPFISYGGSSLVALMVGFALLP